MFGYTGDDLTNFWGLVAMGAAFGLTGMTLSDKRWKIGCFVAGGLFLLAGLFWGSIKAAIPSAGPFISQITAQPSNWFLLLLVLVVALWVHQWRKELLSKIYLTALAPNVAPNVAIEELKTQINRVGNQAQESIAGLNNRLNVRIAKLERLAEDPPPPLPKVNWMPWKAMPDYSVMQLARLLTLRDPGENDLSGEIVAYRDLIMKCIESGALPHIKEFRISDWDGKAYEQAPDFNTRILKGAALKWAKENSFPLDHIA